MRVWRKSDAYTGCAGGSSRVTSRSSTLWGGQNSKCGALKRCGDIGSSSGAPFRISWYAQAHTTTDRSLTAPIQPSSSVEKEPQEKLRGPRAGGKKGGRNVRTTTGELAQSPTGSQGLARTLGLAAAIVASVVATAPTSPRSNTSLITSGKASHGISLLPIDPSQQSCGRCVLCRPSERERRNPMVRVPCECVPSMPARWR